MDATVDEVEQAFGPASATARGRRATRSGARCCATRTPRSSTSTGSTPPGRGRRPGRSRWCRRSPASAGGPGVSRRSTCRSRQRRHRCGRRATDPAETRARAHPHRPVHTSAGPGTVQDVPGPRAGARAGARARRRPPRRWRSTEHALGCAAAIPPRALALVAAALLTACAPAAPTAAPGPTRRPRRPGSPDSPAVGSPSSPPETCSSTRTAPWSPGPPPRAPHRARLRLHRRPRPRRADHHGRGRRRLPPGEHPSRPPAARSRATPRSTSSRRSSPPSPVPATTRAPQRPTTPSTPGGRDRAHATTSTPPDPARRDRPLTAGGRGTTLLDVHGVRVAQVAATFGTNGVPVPKGRGGR